MARPTPKDDDRRALFGWLTDKDIEKWTPATASRLAGRSPGADRLPQLGKRRDSALIAGGIGRRPLGLACRRCQGTEGVGCDRSQDGTAGTAYELEHSATSRCIQATTQWSTMLPIASPTSGIRSFDAVPVPVLCCVREHGRPGAAKIKTALHKAAEIACGNVPELPGPVVIGLDTSGSMGMRGYG